MKFKINNYYRGVGSVGTCDIRVISRTEKSIKIKTTFGVNRVMIKVMENGVEYACFKAWSFDATDIYTSEEKMDDAYDAAYVGW